MALEITTVNGHAVADEAVSVPYTTELRIEGIGLLGNNRSPPFATVACPGASPPTRTVRGAGPPDGTWNAAPFTLPASPNDSIQYNVTAINQANPADKDFVTITVLAADRESKGAAVKQASGRHGTLALDPPPPGNPVAKPLFIVATGTVLDPLNSVFCTLTPIDENGASTGPAQSSPATMNGNTWSVMFVPPPNVAVAPGGAVNGPNQYNGSYLFEAKAPNEGSLSIGVEVPAPN